MKNQAEAFAPACALTMDEVFHIGTREVFAKLFTGERDVVFLRFLLLHHNGEHGVLVQLAALTELFHPLRLRE